MSLSISKDQFILGNYKIGKTLGQGTFGKVKLGVHIATEEKVAVKILEKQKIVQQADMERVTRQICILKRLRHPNIIQLYEIIQTKKDIYLIMQYAEGGQLFDYIVKKKRVEEREAVFFMQQILAGVQYIHKNGIVHRDLKPQNLLLDHNKNIKIVDFGLSNQYKPGQKLKTACGSPCYAAPQMIAGKLYQCLNVDIWSCGVIMYALLCGYLPFQDPNTNKLYKKILAGEFDIPKFITNQAKDLMTKILNTDPQTRYKIEQIRSSKWYKLVAESPQLSTGVIVGKDQINIDERVLQQLQHHNVDLKQARNFLLNNRHNQTTSLYYLLIQKYKRIGFPKRSHSPIIFRPNQRPEQKLKNLTDRQFLIPKKKKNQTIQASKNDSMNASNIISSLIQANKNNHKLKLNLNNKKNDAIQNLINGNFDKVQDNKAFPQKDLSPINQSIQKNEVNGIRGNNRLKLNLNNKKQEGIQYLIKGNYEKIQKVQDNKTIQKDVSPMNQTNQKNQLNANRTYDQDKTLRTNHQARISLNEYNNSLVTAPNVNLQKSININNTSINKNSVTKKVQQSGNYSKRGQLSDQLKQISLKIDREIQELKKQNDNYVNSQYTEKKEVNITVAQSPNSSLNRKRISQDISMSSKTRESEKSKIDQIINVNNGPFNPRAVFNSNPKSLYRKIVNFLQSNNIKYIQHEKLTIQIQRKLRIWLQSFQNIQNMYIICFNEKNNLSERLITFLQM